MSGGDPRGELEKGRGEGLKGRAGKAVTATTAAAFFNKAGAGAAVGLPAPTALGPRTL